MEIELRGRVAIVTGAARGIGAATARRLAASGAAVLVADIDAPGGEAAAAAITAAGGRAAFQLADVAVEADIQAMVAAAVTRWGRLDILVSNAHFEVRGSVEDLSAEDWDRSYAVLVRAAFLGGKHAVPHLRAAGGGSIIHIASVLGRLPTPRYATYTSAKAAIPALSRQMALDHGRNGIRVNTITPGEIDTDPARAGTPDRSSEAARCHPLGRTGLPEDIAAAICFLVSDQAGFITGADLLVDGGMSIPWYTVPVAWAAGGRPS